MSIFAPVVPIAPEVELIVNVPVVDILVAAVWVMVPEPVTARVTPPFAVRFAPIFIFVPVVFKLTLPLPRLTAFVTPIVFPVFNVNVLGTADNVNVAVSVNVMLVLTVLSVDATFPRVKLTAPVLLSVPPIVPVPVAVSVALPAVSVPVNEIPELVPVLVRVAAPVVVKPVTVIPVPDEPLSVNVTEDGLFVVLEMEVFAESVMNTVPAVLRDIVAAFVSMLLPEAPTVPAPAPVTRDNVPAVDIFVAACCVMVPVPLVVRVTELPVKLALTAMVPLVPAVSDKTPLALMVLDAVMLPEAPAVSVRLKIAPVDAPLIVTALESLTYTLPVVLAAKLDAAVSILLPDVPTAPEPEARVTVPPVNVALPLSVIVPAPFAVTVMLPVLEEPVVTLAFSATPAPVPAVRMTLPELPTVMELFTVIVPDDAAESIKEKTDEAPEAVEAALIVTAPESVT